MKYPALQSGIYELMQDLGKGLNNPDTLMLGGGNPAIMEETQNFFIPILTDLMGNPEFFRKAFQSYSPPQGEESFITTVINYFHQITKWKISAEHICITQGSQQGFYMLYNYLIGRFNSSPKKNTNNSVKPVLMAVKTPDYIGYFDLIPKDHFLSVAGKITDYGDGTFKYGIDFSTLEAMLDKDGQDYQIQALVISSPNNPSSHVLSQSDTNRLYELAEQYDKLLIFDHAYGFPFPDIIFEETTNYPFTSNTLHCFSFSKIGLPGLRTGIMIGEPILIEKMTILNGIVNLAPSSFTSTLLDRVLKNPGFDKYIQEDLFPHYQKRQKAAFQHLQKSLQGTSAKIHRAQGGFFLWLWIPSFPLSSYQLYEKLKKEKVVVVPGNYFFAEESDHKDAYLRISYTMEEEKVIKGLKIIGDTIKKTYSQV